MKIRCSSLGKIMTAPRSKSEVLSQTAKSYIEELAKEHLFGIKKVFKSRYTDKGNEVEEKAKELFRKFIAPTQQWDDVDGYITDEYNAKQCSLIAVDENGTDLYAVIDAICPELGTKILFHTFKFRSRSLIASCNLS